MPPRRSLALPLLMLVLVLAACAPEARPAPAPPQPASGAASGDATTAPAAAPSSTVAARPAMQTFHWAGQFPATDAGVYVAMERGYFAEQGVDLEYVNFGSASEM